MEALAADSLLLHFRRSGATGVCVQVGMWLITTATISCRSYKNVFGRCDCALEFTYMVIGRVATASGASCEFC